MKRLYPFLSIFLIPLLSFGAFDIRKEIGNKAFKESGLEKLTDEELATLNAAVAKLMGIQEQVIRSEAELPQGEDRFGLETIERRVKAIFQSQAPDRIESRFVGEFSGWRGNTVFKLENGQVWRQTDNDTFVVKKQTNPPVVIRRGMLGSYMLKIEGFNSSCKVERVE